MSRPDWTLTVDGHGSCEGHDGESALEVLERSGEPWVTVGCRRGGCGICNVRVLSGAYTTGKMSRARVSEAEEAQGWVLACRLEPLSDCTITTEDTQPTP